MCIPETYIVSTVFILKAGYDEHHTHNILYVTLSVIIPFDIYIMSYLHPLSVDKGLVYMCVQVCVCVCMYVYIYICMYIYVCMYVYVYVCKYKYVCVFMYVYVKYYIFVVSTGHVTLLVSLQSSDSVTWSGATNDILMDYT